MVKSQATDASFKRPPVVGILGHIDHGKSTLLDYIRKSNVVEKEAGGITQHISAYEVIRPDGRKITFLDTPGHEAFANVRTRGASAADIAVLVVSGEDGVKPQTVEVYKHIQEAKLPFIVAITKMDKPAADVERTKQSLAEAGIYVEGYGGDISFVAVSAKTGAGVDELLDLILLQADLNNISSDIEALASGVVIESRMDPKRGVIAVVIIKNGTLRKGTFATAGNAMTPLRYLLDAAGNQVEELSCGSPAQIVGWDKMPVVGSEFKNFLKKNDALEEAEDNKAESKNKEEVKMAEGVINLPIVIKADTAGSLEAVEAQIAKLSRERIVPKVISSSVGSIGDNDVKFAISTPGTLVMGFHTKIDSTAAALAERTGVNIALFDIIYELTERVTKLLEEREPRIEVEEVLGTAKVLRIFSTTKNKQVLGARVLTGKITLGASVKILRRDAEITRGKIRELQQARVNVPEVIEGTEFGALVESKFEVAPGDIIEAITLVTK